jgi:hypothetical protein
VRDANIKCYRRMMAGLLDEKHRKVIERLLKEEQLSCGSASATMQRPGNHSREGFVS